MTHQIDMSNGRANMAYVGETPWHGLGSELTPGADLATWQREAGLDWTVQDSPCFFTVDGFEQRVFPGKKTLYRSDTSAPLSVMSNGFHVVQPSDVLALYSEIAKAGGFTLETAGCLSGGKRIWFLARVSEGADVVGGDRVRPFILGATSFDGTMATTLKFTAIRVVCNNTITAALGNAEGLGKSETDDTRPGREQIARTLHSTRWTDQVADGMRQTLGIVHSQFERFMVEARSLAARPMTDTEADDFVALLLEPYSGTKDGKRRDARETRAYDRILELFRGAAVGHSLAGNTRWGMLNAVTELLDHERGHKQSARLESAWFGTGAAIKERAATILSGEFRRIA